MKTIKKGQLFNTVRGDAIFEAAEGPKGGKVACFPAGGGMRYRIPVEDIKELLDHLPQELVKAHFSIEEDAPFPGYHVPQNRWNGWAQPAFTREVAEKIVSDAFGYVVKWKGDKLMFRFAEQDEPCDECAITGEGAEGERTWKVNPKGCPECLDGRDTETALGYEAQTPDGELMLFDVGDGWIWSDVEVKPCVQCGAPDHADASGDRKCPGCGSVARVFRPSHVLQTLPPVQAVHFRDASRCTSWVTVFPSKREALVAAANWLEVEFAPDLGDDDLADMVQEADADADACGAELTEVYSAPE